MNDETTVFVPLPEAPCRECVENARHRDEEFGIVYCHHVGYGGVYLVEAGQWQLVGPFGSEVEFRRAIATSLARRMAQRGRPH